MWLWGDKFTTGIHGPEEGGVTEAGITGKSAVNGLCVGMMSDCVGEAVRTNVAGLGGQSVLGPYLG